MGKIIRPNYFDESVPASSEVKEIIKDYGLLAHPEGGYYAETDRSPFYMESPYYPGNSDGSSPATALRTVKPEDRIKKPIIDEDGNQLTPYRNYSTLIFYLLTSESPVGRFHKNKSRVIHILQKGRGTYVLIHPDGRVESFDVGFDRKKGEKQQWVVDGGVYKASFVKPMGSDPYEGTGHDCLLISEVVVPGFEFEDHSFLPDMAYLVGLVGEEKAKELEFLLGPKK